MPEIHARARLGGVSHRQCQAVPPREENSLCVIIANRLRLPKIAQSQSPFARFVEIAVEIVEPNLAANCIRCGRTPPDTRRRIGILFDDSRGILVAERGRLPV
jgi:hypothetical protein